MAPRRRPGRRSTVSRRRRRARPLPRHRLGGDARGLCRRARDRRPLRPGSRARPDAGAAPPRPVAATRRSARRIAACRSRPSLERADRPATTWTSPWSPCRTRTRPPPSPAWPQRAIHLIVDKPAARSAGELRPAAAAVDGRAACASYRADPPLHAGGAGGARCSSPPAIWAGWSPPRPCSPPGPSPSATRPMRCSTARRSGGGVLSWLGVHDIDALLWLSGRADRRGRRR